ncbi:MAG: hypothetical protein KDB61_13635, partial [Planctomycetes bacterium]|nr:hypothetical protein [Planctomycetota bacterium]
MQSRTPTVFLPRTTPRQEQVLRARSLAARGLSMCLEDWDGPSIRAATEEALNRGRVRGQLPDLQGTKNTVSVARELLREQCIQFPHLKVCKP